MFPAMHCLKKPTLDKDELSNYRPISNLSLLSKIIECIVKARLSDHLTSNNLLNPRQSAYSKHHSTETALLYIHDHLINAICSRKISCLPTWPAFDTIDHNFLLTRLSSWFGIQCTALNWFKSYLSSPCFTTPLSTLISSMSLNHHLYVYDTQLFLSFHPSEFHSNITHLQNALQQISSWMTANLLSLNSSKNEFLLIRLKQQLSKIHDSSLTTTYSAHNLGFIFDEHLTFSDQISALSKSCLNTVSTHISTSKQPAPLPPPLSILNLITVTLSITNYKLST